MKGKINSGGWLYKEGPDGKMMACDCCANREKGCHWSCVAFEGPIPDGRCTVDVCPHASTPCAECEHYKPCIAVRICQGRTLQFDEFEDERVR